jgi:hypothetical protein
MAPSTTNHKCPNMGSSSSSNSSSTKTGSTATAGFSLS